MFQVNHSKEDEIDVERIDIHPPSSSSASGSGNDDIIIVPNGVEDSTVMEVVNDDTTINQGAHGTTSFMSKLFNKKTAAIIFVLGMAAVLGVSINGAAKYKQQQNALAAINGIGGKAGKSISFCEPEPEEVMTCGQSFENTKVVLSEDLFCTDDVDDASKSAILPRFNAAIKVVGPDAVIDCKKHTISQRSSKNAAFCAESFSTRANRQTAKTTCDLFYQVGIWLVDGASAINCKVEHFHSGIYIGKGGEVKKSEVSGNRNGLTIRDEITTGSTTKVKDL